MYSLKFPFSRQSSSHEELWRFLVSAVTVMMVLAHTPFCFPKKVTDFYFYQVIHFTFLPHPWKLLAMITRGNQRAQIFFFF